MNNLIIYGLIALVLALVLFKGRSYFTPGPTPVKAPGPIPNAPAPKWKMTTIVQAGTPCPSGWTKIGEVTCAQ